ncbi:MAG: hypothetical protein AAF700_01890 [Pseudomonadota bacterium]
MSRWGIIKRLALVTAVLLLATTWVSYFDIQGRSFANKLMDFRLLGYTAVDAETFVSTLNIEEKDAYHDVYRILDFVFIGFLCALLYALAKAMQRAGARSALLLATLLFVGLDITENLLVPAIIEGDFSRADLAGWVTLLKFLAISGVGVILFVTWRRKGFS